MKLTIQQLANLCMYSWELRRELGFYMQDPETFRNHVAGLPALKVQEIMENLGLLFRTIEEVGLAEVELKANGHPSVWAPLCTTQTAHAAGADEKTYSAPIDEVPTQEG